MSNLESARQAIEAELEHAKMGVSFYQSRAEALQDALTRLTDVDAADTTLSAVAGLGGMDRGLAARRGRKARFKKHNIKDDAVGSVDDKLPPTGKDFWPGLIDNRPRSASEIFDAAVQALGINITRDQAKKLAQRQANALSILTKKGLISSSGSGRSRRFFR